MLENASARRAKYVLSRLQYYTLRVGVREVAATKLTTYVQQTLPIVHSDALYANNVQARPTACR